MYRTPVLATKRLEIYRAMFEMQLPDTLESIRKILREWSAAHLVLSETGTTRRTLSRDQLRDLLLERIAPDGGPHDPSIVLENPLPPTGTILTIVPNAIKPRIVTEYSGWAYLPYLEMKKSTSDFVTRVLGSVPGKGLASALFQDKKCTVLLDGSASSTSTAQFVKALEGVVNKEATVTFFDSLFGFHATGAAFLSMAAQVLQMPGRKQDMLYFDPDGGWFAAFDPGGQVRIARVA